MDYNPHQQVERWDRHTDRMSAAAKAGIGAVTLLNSGSWIALLSQAEALSKIENSSEPLGIAMVSWGMGALLGTLCWLFVYWSAAAQYRHDMDHRNSWHRIALSVSFWMGLTSAIAALALFGRGVAALGQLLS